MVFLKLNEGDVLEMYSENKHSLRDVAKRFNTSHHRIKRILIRNNVEISRNYKSRALTSGHKLKISASHKGMKKPWVSIVKHTKERLYKNMVSHLSFEVSLDWIMQFEDVEKVKFLNKCICRHERNSIGWKSQDYIEYINKFYYEHQFNLIYNNWILNKEKLLRPSIDHIIPISRGGSLFIENIQFLPWFENWAKSNSTMDEWLQIKQNIHKYMI